MFQFMKAWDTKLRTTAKNRERLTHMWTLEKKYR